MPIEEAKLPETLITAIPRINIGIFCDNEATLQAMQQVAADRRMSRAHITVHTGGIIGAFQAHSGALSPNLLIVESHSPRDTILTELSQLAQVCDPATKVIVIGHVNDVIRADTGRWASRRRSLAEGHGTT